jgi:hypothetical protein
MTWMWGGSSCILIPADPRLCPEGTNYDSEKCITAPLKQPVCKSLLELWDSHCILEEMPACDVGVWNRQYCLLDETPYYAPPTQFNGVECVSTHPPTCPEGSYIYDDHCHSNKPASYPPPFYLVKDHCVDARTPKCPYSFTLIGAVCCSDKPP